MKCTDAVPRVTVESSYEIETEVFEASESRREDTNWNLEHKNSMVLCFSVRTASTLLFLSFSSPSAKALATYRRALVRFSSTKQQFILPFSTRTAPVLLRRRRTSQHHQHHQSALQNQGSRLKSVMKSTPEDFDDFASVQDLSYRDMQKWCKERGIPANGTTDAIRSRLVEHINMNANGVSKTKSLKTEKQSQKKTPSPKSKSKARTRPEANADADGANPNPRTTSSSSSSSMNNSSSTPKRKSSSPKTPTSSSSRKRQRIQPGSLKPPEDFLQLYSIVEELRADRTAPLDSDGGEALPQRDQGTTIYRFQVLVALMLSSQTKDAAVGEAMRALQQHGLTVENIHATESTVLNGLIQKVGFHNNKTKYLKKTAETLISEYGGDIPSTAEEMMKLTGIGPKMVRFF